MINPKYYNTRLTNSSSLLRDREYGGIDRYVQRRLQASPAFIDRLGLDATFIGHEGCVNCLEWSSDGRVLASGSDDFHVILWEPFRKRQLCNLPTKHLGNMFSVKFLPQHNDNVLATAAADKHIYVFDINRHNESLLTCNCHTARVKRLATAPDSPNVFWSAGEDGVVLQLDIREQHRCRSDENRVQLINLTKYMDTNAEAKCLAVNPRRTEFLAVGANDPYARLYDRRMLRLSAATGETGPGADTQSAAIPNDCVSFFCPGHINKNITRHVEHENRAITYLTFNATGTELLVNMGGEHVYLYDLLGAEQPVYLSLPEAVPSKDEEMAPADGDATSGSAATSAASSKRKLPEHIEAYKKMGNDFLENEKYLRAIDQYSEAIALSPDCPVLYLNRATAYMRRMWFGDVYAALRDCHQALRLDPSYIKAHFRLARALLELGRPEEAEECLKELINRFQSYASNHGVMMLHKDIKENRQSSQRQQPQSPENYNGLQITDEEFTWRSKSKDYHKRFVGHCNTTTDIKEANYFGYYGEFIVAGSDDGNFFVWERSTGKINAIYKADGAIVNCVQPHPSICMLATSGIDHDVKIWAPIDDASADARRNVVVGVDKTVEENQQKMKTDPFDLNTRNAFCWNG